MQKDLGEIQRQLNMVETVAEIVQLDVGDGEFIKTDTMHDPDMIPYLQTGLDFEIHLMVKKPEDVLYRWLIHDNVKRIYVHVEAANDLDKLIHEMRNASKDVGVSLNMESPVSAIEHVLREHQIDNVLLMGVTPGKQGQKHNPDILKKLMYLKKHYPDVKTGVDGGMNPITAIPYVEHGADIIVAGSYIVKSDNPVKAFKELNALNDPRRLATLKSSLG